MMRAIALATAVCLSAAGALAAPKTYKLDPDHTIVAFLVDLVLQRPFGFPETFDFRCQ